MKRVQPFLLTILLLGGRTLWSQTASEAPSAEIYSETPSDSMDDRMEVPPPVSGQSYSTSTISEDRSNYIRGAMTFTGAYTDNASGNVAGRSVSDASYSVAPSISLDEKTSRMHAIFTYAPGFTFYQRESGLNEADHNATIDFQYRLSPHFTFTARDSFQKSSSVFNRPDLTGLQGVSSGPTGANFSIIAPIADRLTNVGNVGLNYQFSMNGMVGVSGTFSNLHYPNPSEVPGLFDSSSSAFSAFHSLRLSKMHYIGVTYEYQRLLAYPLNGTSETQTNALLFFYTLYLREKFSISFFGGPQHSDTTQPPLPPLNTRFPAQKAWTPAAGASLSWQGRVSNIALSFSHEISGGGGLAGAVKMDAASANFRQQLSKTLTGSAGVAYTKNDVLQSALAPSTNGHTFSATASLQRQFRQFNVGLGYTRLQQSYGGVAVISAAPDTNREFVSVSYQFSRPLGR